MVLQLISKYLLNRGIGLGRTFSFFWGGEREANLRGFWHTKRNLVMLDKFSMAKLLDLWKLLAKAGKLKVSPAQQSMLTWCMLLDGAAKAPPQHVI